MFHSKCAYQQRLNIQWKEIGAVLHFLLVAGAIAGTVEVLGIQNTSTQADKKIVDALLDAGADVQVERRQVYM